MLDEIDVVGIMLTLANKYEERFKEIDKEKYPIVWNQWKTKNETITHFINDVVFEINKKKEQLNVK